MRLTIPLTGTVILNPDRQTWQSSSDVGVAVDIGDIAWQAVSFDWENGTVEVEVVEVPRHDLIKLPGKVARYEKDLTEKEIKDIQDGKVVAQMIPETEVQYNIRKAAVLAAAQSLLSKPKEELYAMSGSPRLNIKQAKGV